MVGFVLMIRLAVVRVVLQFMTANRCLEPLGLDSVHQVMVSLVVRRESPEQVLADVLGCGKAVTVAQGSASVWI